MLKDRFTALLIDYLLILLYLITLAAVIAVFYYLVFDGIPEFNHLTSQLVAFLTTVLPVTVIFAIMESKPSYGTIGKRKKNIKVIYKNKSFKSSLIRNAIKFLPWQIGHIGVIAAIYNDYSTMWFMVGNIGFLLAVIYIFMVIFNENHRHIPDIVAGVKVVKSK